MYGLQSHPEKSGPDGLRLLRQLRAPAQARARMILLPAVDIRDGKAVRLRQGHFDDETVYADDPLEAARSFVEAGARFLHVVDLDGAREGEPVNLHHVERIARELEVPVELGGGLRSIASIRRALKAGAARVVLGTAAFTDPDLLDEALAAFTARVLVGVDVRGGKVSVSGWTRETQMRGEDAIRRMQQRGVTRFVYTNVDRDGMLEGPDLDEVRRVWRGGARALPLLGRHRVARRPRGAARPAPRQPRRRDLRQGALRGALRRGRGPGGAGGLMLLRRVIPCLDVDKGRVVKGVEFLNLRDAGDPVELAVRYQDEGADEIVFLDITASHERRETVAELARRCADDVFIPFTIGGGVRSVEDAQAVLDAGADKVSVNSAAVARPGAARRDGGRCSAPSAWCWRSTPGARPTGPTASTSRAAGGRSGATRSSGRARAWSAARGRSC